MQTRRKLKPGQPGTIKYVKQYGNKLFCVRYRYDEESKTKIKTIELIVHTEHWEPKPNKPAQNKIMKIKIEYGEIHLGRAVKAAGGKWNGKIKLWELPYKEVVELGLTDRIVKEKRREKRNGSN